jgi:hypothetical protein
VAQVQLPLVHLRPPLQVVPQPPQLAASVLVLTQLVPHSVPVLHWHLPAAHDCPLPQLLPQAPQLAALVCVSVQVLLHTVCPAAQAQALFTHD